MLGQDAKYYWVIAARKPTLHSADEDPILKLFNNSYHSPGRFIVHKTLRCFNIMVLLSLHQIHVHLAINIIGLGLNIRIKLFVADMVFFSGIYLCPHICFFSYLS